MNLKPKAVSQRPNTFTRLLAPAPEHVKQPAPCCHMYACYGVTNVRGWRPAGSEGGPNRTWQYIDWPAGDRWPAVPMMILCDSTGRNATDAEYRSYIQADMEATQYALENYLMAEWREVPAWAGARPQTEKGKSAHIFRHPVRDVSCHAR